MSAIPFYLIEAFGNKPFTGNPAAVCLLKEKLSHTSMQKIATQFNLSETAFVLPGSNGGYEIRWFTPLCEVSLCGHATLASARALWESGVEGEVIRFTSQSGEFHCEKTAEEVQLEFPKYAATPLDPPTEELKKLFPEAVSFSSHGRSLLVQLKEATDVISYEAKSSLFQALPFSGVYITAQSIEPAYDFVSRCFFPTEGIPEDPVTGSAYCLLAPFWSEKLNKSSLTAFQASARSGVLKIEVLEKSVLLSGKTRVFAKGSLMLNSFLGER